VSVECEPPACPVGCPVGSITGLHGQQLAGSTVHEMKLGCQKAGTRQRFLTLHCCHENRRALRRPCTMVAVRHRLVLT